MLLWYLCRRQGWLIIGVEFVTLEDSDRHILSNLNGALTLQGRGKKCCQLISSRNNGASMGLYHDVNCQVVDSVAPTQLECDLRGLCGTAKC